jgi:hypothetical protein
MGVPTRPTEKVIKPSAVKMFQEILRIEGVRGLYRGILPELLKVIPMVSVTFSVYELAMDRLKNGL